MRFDGSVFRGWKMNNAINQREGWFIVNETGQFHMAIKIIRCDSWHGLGCLTGKKTAFNLFPVQIAPDENQPCFTGFIIPPWPLMIPFHNHMDALKHEPFVIVLKGHNAFQA